MRRLGASSGGVPFIRQDEQPDVTVDGSEWVTDADGSGNDTSSRYQYSADADRWELNSAVGPSEPSLGTPVAGATWRDTSVGSAKQYDGASFVSIAPNTTAEPSDTTLTDGDTVTETGTAAGKSITQIDISYNTSKANRKLRVSENVGDSGQLRDVTIIDASNGEEVGYSNINTGSTSTLDILSEFGRTLDQLTLSMALNNGSLLDSDYEIDVTGEYAGPVQPHTHPL